MSKLSSKLGKCLIELIHVETKILTKYRIWNKSNLYHRILSTYKI